MYNAHWSNPADILQSASKQFLLDHWKDQPCHIEVMVEKDALSGILWPVCQQFDVRFTANKGYSSSSAMYEAGGRMLEADDNGKDLVVLYLGDHDPSGIDMSRDITDRLGMFTKHAPMTIHRLALNYDQVEVWKPPENPAKQTDSKFEAYVERFGESSWELDAIEPVQLAELVTSAIREVLDVPKWNAVEKRQKAMRKDIGGLAEQWLKDHPEEANRD